MAETSKLHNHLTDVTSMSQQLYRNDCGQDESQKIYNDLAALDMYEQRMEEAKFFNSHDQLMAAVLELFPTRRDITILDCGSGTGVFGQKLSALGFTTMDGLDPSTEMVKRAVERRVYRRYLCNFFTDRPTPGIDNDTYDLLLMCGVMHPGAIPLQAFTEAVRIVKPGGYIVNCMRAEYIENADEYKGRWNPFMQQLYSEGKLRLVSEHRYPNHYFHHEGLRLVYQVL